MLMGRKRISPEQKRNPHSSNDIDEVLVELVDLCGFVPPADPPHPRLQLLQALRALSRSLLDPRLRESSLMRHNDTASFLLQVEDLLQRLREDLLPVAKASLEDDASEVLFLRQQLESCSTISKLEILEPRTMSWALLGRSMLASLTRQLRLELIAIMEVKRALDFVFDDANANKTNAQLAMASAISTLERKEVVDNFEYIEAVGALFQKQEEEERTTPESVKDRQSTSMLGPAHSTNDSRENISRSCAEIENETTIADAIHKFILVPTENLPSVLTLLVVGAEGSGKTYTCENAALAAKDTECLVIRPKLPIDFLGSSVGETEDLLVSVFGASVPAKGKVILILDDVDHILGRNDSVPFSESHLQRRCRSTFLVMMDLLHNIVVAREGAVLVLCTSGEESTVLTWRFDRVYYLELPRENARKRMLFECLDLQQYVNEANPLGDEQNLIDIVGCIVEATAGRTYAEIMQLCRQAFQQAASAIRPQEETPRDFITSVLIHLKERLSSLTPASLRDGVIDSYVDMRVLSAADLASAAHDNGEFVLGNRFPFQGPSATKAWKELEATIVIPLCRSRQLAELLDCSGTGARRLFAGGLLLAGPAGSGKSALALHSAKYAASLSPSIKLLDVSCTSLIHKELGASERAVHHLFDAARKAAPCLLIMDGIETIAAVRGNDATTEGTMDRVLSTLLVELDGVEDFSDSVEQCSIAIIGITHNEKWIDSAIKRPGRLERTVYLELDWNDSNI